MCGCCKLLSEKNLMSLTQLRFSWERENASLEFSHVSLTSYKEKCYFLRGGGKPPDVSRLRYINLSKIIILISCSWARPSIHVCSLVHVTYVSRTYALPNINTTIIATEPFCAVAVNFLVKKTWWAQHSCVSVGKEKMLLWNFPHVPLTSYKEKCYFLRGGGKPPDVRRLFSLARLYPSCIIFLSKIIILISCSWARPTIHVCSLVHATYVSRTYALPNINTILLLLNLFVLLLLKKPWWA